MNGSLFASASVTLGDFMTAIENWVRVVPVEHFLGDRRIKTTSCVQFRCARWNQN